MLPRTLALLVVLLAGWGIGRLHAQAPSPPATALRVFLDCQTHCPDDYIRTEVPWVEYVRNRQDATIHLLISDQDAAAGDLVILRFIGLGPFAGQDQELTYLARDTDTEERQRAGFIEVMKLGLVRYAAAAPVRDRLRVVYDAPAAGAPALGTPPRDPWNNWVFEVGGRGSYEGESQSSSSQFRGFLSAERITDAWKLDLYASGSRQRSRFTLSDGEELVRTVRGAFANILVGRSLGERTSLGVRANVQNSTRDNLDLALRTSAELEVSLFPYRESTRRLVTLAYGVGLYRADYTEETIHGRLEESRPRHYAVMSLDLIEPWGQAEFQLEAQSYLDDLAKNRLGVRGELDMRITRGLSFSVNARYSRVRDQLSLARGDATDDEILLELRQLATDFTFDLSFGLSYTFGSIFSSVVNPRFRRGDPAL